MAKAPTGFTASKREQFLNLIRSGMMRGAAADQLDLNRRKIRDYIEDDEKFKADVVDAEVDATEHVKEALYQAAISGQVAAAKAWLELQGVGIRKPASAGREQPAPEDTGPEMPYEDAAITDQWAELDNVTPIKR